MKNARSILGMVCLAALAILPAGCLKEDNPGDYRPEHTLIFCGMGFNNISSSISGNVSEMLEGSYIPTVRSRKGLIFITHFRDGSYSDRTPVDIVRVYKSRRGETIMDTLKSITGVDVLTDPAVLGEALRYAMKAVPSDSYGFIFSSHGTGWLPKGYYSTHGSPTLAGILCNGANTFSDMPGPPVKSLGNEFAGSDANQIELDLPEFVNSVPMHSDYMILDMCLMGGVEVAYEFKDLTDMLIISPTEILAGGMSYENMVRNLLAGNKPDLRAVCTDYYRKYADGNSYATVSLIDCTNLDTLASVCRDLFATYRQQIADVNPASVQRFFRKDVSGRYKHWFYDLQDILSKSGISPADSARLDAALRAAVPCKAATDKFLPEKDGFRIDNFCGLSMYLPKMGDNFLDSFYDTLGWNVETGLVNLGK